jgi:hypothetical protein
MHSSPSYKDKDHTEIIWRTMICDRELGSQRKAPEFHGEYFRSYYEHLKLRYGLEGPVSHLMNIQSQIRDSPLGYRVETEEQLRHLVYGSFSIREEEAALFERAATKFCYSTRVIVTNSGCVGVVPRCTQKVDSIVVIKGVNVPMVLRQGENRFKVVGPGYFWGFMDGEAFEMDDMEEEKIVLM